MRGPWMLALVLAGCPRRPPDAAPAAAPPRVGAFGTSGGSGGAVGEWSAEHALGEQRGAFTVYAPDPGGSVGVVVLLHADDGTPRRPVSRRPLRALAEARDLLLVAIDSPGPVDSGCWWSPHKHLRTDYVVDLLETEIFARYDVDLDRVYLTGKSGGGFFAAGAPFYRPLPFGGGVVGVCGGDVPRVESDVDWCAFTETEDDPPYEPAPAARAQVGRGWRLYLAHTSGDPWVRENDAAAALWRSTGAPVTQEIVGPGGHCALDDVAWLVRGISWVDG